MTNVIIRKEHRLSDETVLSAPMFKDDKWHNLARLTKEDGYTCKPYHEIRGGCTHINEDIGYNNPVLDKSQSWELTELLTILETLERQVRLYRTGSAGVCSSTRELKLFLKHRSYRRVEFINTEEIPKVLDRIDEIFNIPNLKEVFNDNREFLTKQACKLTIGCAGVQELYGDLEGYRLEWNAGQGDYSITLHSETEQLTILVIAGEQK